MRAAAQFIPRRTQPLESLTPEQRLIVRCFNSQAYIYDSYDVQKGHIWDSITLEAGDSFTPRESPFFVVPQGKPDARGILKTAADTSMLCGEKLIAPDAFAIRRILFTFSRTAAEADVYAIAEGTIWALHFGCKDYLRSPIISLQMADLPKAPIRVCQYCKSVYVQETRCPGCGAAEFSLSNIGGAAGRGFVLDIGEDSPGIVLEQEERFSIRFEGQSRRVSEPMKLWVHFEGLHARGIR